MKSTLTTKQVVFLIASSLLGGFVVGMGGLAVGVEYGGNFCDKCEVNGVTGYEATGQVGFLVGAFTGLLAGALGAHTLFKRLRGKG